MRRATFVVPQNELVGPNLASILVTGSEGFIGNAVAKALAEANHDVIGMDLAGQKSSNVPYTYVQGDIRKISDLTRVTRDVEFIYHFAAASNLNFSRENPLETINLNVMATANLSEICRRKGARLIFASSDHIYGNRRKKILTENTPPAPNEIYASSKVAGEHVVRSFGKRNTILRLGTVYGPRMRRELAIFLFLSKAHREDEIAIHSPGTQRRQYVYIDDIVEGSTLAMKTRAEGEIINLPGSETISVMELVYTCIRLIRSKSRV